MTHRDRNHLTSSDALLCVPGQPEAELRKRANVVGTEATPGGTTSATRWYRSYTWGFPMRRRKQIRAVSGRGSWDTCITWSNANISLISSRERPSLLGRGLRAPSPTCSPSSHLGACGMSPTPREEACV
ncbi:unnamed protein product [Merluccius merluccius]